MLTLDDFLRKIPLRDKNVAVIGPNYYVGDDPSLLYFANRMANQAETLTVLDAKPHWENESHGNIQSHMDDFESMVHKGIRAKCPEVIIGDITKTKIEEKFDLIYEVGTFKCIVNLKAASLRSRRYSKPAKQVLDSYCQMLKRSGTAILVYPDIFESAGYSVLKDILADYNGIRWNLEPKNFIDMYELRNMNKNHVRKFGQEDFRNEDHSTKLTLNQKGYVRLGSGYRNMRIIRIQKN